MATKATIDDVDQIYRTELELLRFVAAKKRGRTVTECATKFRTTRQCAYARLERLCEKEMLDYTFESIAGTAREQARYTPSEHGAAVLALRWQRDPARSRLMVRA